MSVGAESVEMEIDSKHWVDVKCRGYSLETMGFSIVPESSLVAS